MAEYKTHLKDRWYVFLISMNDVTLENRAHCEVTVSEANNSYTMQQTVRQDWTTEHTELR